MRPRSRGDAICRDEPLAEVELARGIVCTPVHTQIHRGCSLIAGLAVLSSDSLNNVCIDDVTEPLPGFALESRQLHL
jgi:hypothetical protein